MEVVPLDDEKLPAVKRLNMGTLPIPVQDQVYRDAITEMELNWVAMKDNKVIGAILVHDEGNAFCIRTLAVDIRERGKGVGHHLLARVIEHATNTKKSILLHVQVDNYDAIQVYQRHGFKIFERIPNYYRRLSCVDCFVMTLDSTRE